MKVLRDVWFTITVFERDWDKFAGGSFNVTFKNSDGSEITESASFSASQYAGGDRGSLSPYGGSRTIGTQGTSHKIYYSSKIELACSLTGGKYVLSEGPWDTPPETDGTNWNGSPSSWAAWSNTFWDQEAPDLGVHGGVNNVHFGIKRDEVELCELDGDGNVVAAGQGNPTCDPSVCNEVVTPDDDDFLYYGTLDAVQLFNLCDPVACAEGERNADGSCPAATAWVTNTQYEKGDLVDYQGVTYYASAQIAASATDPLAMGNPWTALADSTNPNPANYAGGGSAFVTDTPVAPESSFEVILCPKVAIDPCNPDPPCSEAKLDDAYVLHFIWSGPGNLPPHADIPRYLGESEAIPTGWSKYIWDGGGNDDNACFVPPGFRVDFTKPVTKVTPGFGKTSGAYSLCAGACASTEEEGTWTLVEYLMCNVKPWRGADSPYNDPFNPLQRTSEYQKSLGRGDAGYSNGTDTLDFVSGVLTAGTFNVLEGFGPLGPRVVGKQWVVSGGVVFEDTEAIGLMVATGLTGTDPLTGLDHFTHEFKFFVEKNASLVPPQPSVNDLTDYNITTDVTVGMWSQDGTSTIGAGDTGYSALITNANTSFYESLLGKSIYYTDYVAESSDGLPPYEYVVDEKSATITGFSDAKHYFPEGKSFIDYPGFAQEESDQLTYITVPYGSMLIDTDGDGKPDRTVETWLHKDSEAILPWSLDQGWISENVTNSNLGTNPLEPEDVFEGCSVLDKEHDLSAKDATHVRLRLNDDAGGKKAGDTIKIHISQFAPTSNDGTKCTEHTPSTPSNPRQVGVGTPPPAPTNPPEIPPTNPPTNPPPESGYFPKCSNDKLCITINGTTYDFWRQSDSYDQGWTGNVEIPHSRKEGRDWYVSRPASGGSWPTGPGGYIDSSILGTTSGPFYLDYDDSSSKWKIYRGSEEHVEVGSTDSACPEALNFGSGVTIATGQCEGGSGGGGGGGSTPPPSVQGCTDSTAVNYVPWATEDDGSCVFQDDVVRDPWLKNIKSITVNDKIYEWVEQKCFTIKDATNTSPIIVTTAGFDGVAKPMNLNNGDTVIIDDVKGNPATNGVFVIENIPGEPNKMKLVGSTGNGDYDPLDQYLSYNRPEIHYIIRKCVSVNEHRMVVSGAWDATFNGIYKQAPERFGYPTYQHVDDSTKEFAMTWDGQWVLKYAGVPKAYGSLTSNIECNPDETTWTSVDPSAMVVTKICGIRTLYIGGFEGGAEKANGKYVINDQDFTANDSTAWTALINGYSTWKQVELSNGNSPVVGEEHFLGVGNWYSVETGEDPQVTHWHVRTMNTQTQATRDRASGDVYACPTTPQQTWDTVFGVDHVAETAPE